MHYYFQGESSLLEIDVADILFSELQLYVRSNRSNEPHYREQLKLRLNVLRHYFGSSVLRKMTSDDLTRLWEMLIEPAEREQLLDFFTHAGKTRMFYARPVLCAHHDFCATGVKRAELSCAFELKECIFAFTNFICSPALDWSQLGEESFKCFKTYVQGLQKIDMPPSQRPPALGNVVTVFVLLFVLNSNIKL